MTFLPPIKTIEQTRGTPGPKSATFQCQLESRRSGWPRQARWRRSWPGASSDWMVAGPFAFAKLSIATNRNDLIAGSLKRPKPAFTG